MIFGKGNRWRIQIRRGRICRKALKRRLRGGFGWGFHRLEPFESLNKQKRETQTTSVRISLFWRSVSNVNRIIVTQH